MKCPVAVLLLLSLVSAAAAGEPSTALGVPDTPDVPDAPVAASGRYEVPIGRTECQPLVVLEAGYVVGDHPYRSVIVGRIESEGLDADDGTVGVVLRDFTLDGGDETMPYAPQSYRQNRQKYPDGPPGIHVKSWGFRAEGLSIHSVPGIGLLYERGGSPDRWANDREIAAQSEGRIEDLFIGRCYDGLVVKTADTHIARVDVGGVRGVGIDPGCAAIVEGCHVYGCGTGYRIPQRCYLVGCEAENCGTGLVNHGPGTMITGLRVFSCRTGIDLPAWARVVGAQVTTDRRDAVAIRIGPGKQAHHAVVDCDLELYGGSTGVVVSADKTDLTIGHSWGGARTVLVDRPVSDCRLDVCVDGSQVGVEIEQLGRRNRIDITARSCKTPVLLPSGGIDRSNVITVNGKPYPRQ